MVKVSTRKKKMPKPNYILTTFKMGWDKGVWRMWLAESKDFYSEKDLEEITYWKDGECFTVEKIQDEI